MGLVPRLSTSWVSMKLDKSLVSARVSILRAIVAILTFSVVVYLLWLPIFYLFGAFHDLVSHRSQPVIIEPGEE